MEEPSILIAAVMDGHGVSSFTSSGKEKVMHGDIQWIQTDPNRMVE
jgi:hypothetical protein